MSSISAPSSFEASTISEPAPRSFLSRIWPFRLRKVRHRTFGALRPYRDGNYLRTRAHFAPVEREVWLVIRAGAAGPTAAQEKLYLQIEKHYATLLPRMLKSLLAEYQKVRQVQAAVPWPEAATPSDLLKIIPLDAIWLEHGPGHPFVFSFQSELDKDHEFHVFYRDGKMQSIAFEH